MTKRERIADLRRGIASAKRQIEATHFELNMRENELARKELELADLLARKRMRVIVAGVGKALGVIGQHRKQRGEPWLP